MSYLVDLICLCNSGENSAQCVGTTMIIVTFRSCNSLEIKHGLRVTNQSIKSISKFSRQEECMKVSEQDACIQNNYRQRQNNFCKIWNLPEKFGKGFWIITCKYKLSYARKASFHWLSRLIVTKCSINNWI